MQFVSLRHMHVLFCDESASDRVMDLLDALCVSVEVI